MSSYSVGIIGLGSIGERHACNLRTLMPRARIDILTKRKKWNGAPARARLFDSAQEFFSQSHDIYFITNETVKHVETLARVLEHKPKGIFIEKPLSHSLEGLEEMRSMAERQGTVVFVGYNLQFFKPLLKLKELIEKGTLGSVRAVRVSVGQDLRTWRKGSYKTSYSADSSRGGGVVLDLIHDLNYPAWLIGTPLSFVAGYASTVTLPIQSEDIAESIFSTLSGVVVTVHQDYLRVPGERSCEIVGSKGSARWVWDLGAASTIAVQTGKKQRIMTIREDRGRMYRAELKWFLSKVKEGKGYNNLEEALRDMRNATLIKNTYGKKSF